MSNRDLLVFTLSDPVRRDILTTLNRVVWLYGRSEIKLLCELHLGHTISQPAMSKQIGTLVDNSLVNEKRDGSIKRFSINREEVNRLGDLVEKLSRVKMGIKRQGKVIRKGENHE